MAVKKIPNQAPASAAPVTIHCAAADLMSYAPTLSTEKVGPEEIVSWGERDKLPEFIYGLYENCVTLQSIINGIADFVFGGGIVNRTTFVGKNEFGDTLADVVYKSELDILIFGGCFIQVKMNLDGSREVAHLDPRKCRLNRDETLILVSDRWGRHGASDCVKYHRYDPDTLVRDGVQIYYYKEGRSRGVYPVAEYKSAFASVETDIEAKKFDYNNIRNGMSLSGVLNIAGDVPQEAREQIQEHIVDLYTGSRNAGRILTTFMPNPETSSPVTFTPFTANDADDRHRNAVSRAESAIFIAWRAHPILFGRSVQTGFADQNFEEAYQLLYQTHVVKKRFMLRAVFGDIFGDPEALDFIDIEFGNPITNASDEA